MPSTLNTAIWIFLFPLSLSTENCLDLPIGNSSAVFIGHCLSNDKSKNKAAAQDDASEIQWIDLSEVDNKVLAFDHKSILLHYKKWKEAGETFWSTKK